MDTAELSKLSGAFKHSRQAGKPSRDMYNKIAREYLGKNYNNEAKRKATPLNFLRMYAKVYQRQLVPQNPRGLVSTRYSELKPVAHAMQLWMNHRIQEMGLQQVLRDAVLDGLISFAVVKVGLALDEHGYENDPGQPFVELIPFDDWVMDMSVRTKKHCAFMGHRMRLPLRYLKGNPNYQNTDKLKGQQRKDYNEPGDQRSNVTGTPTDEEDIEDMVEIWELWLPRTNMVVTIAADDQGGLSNIVLREAPFIGPECGPYHILGFDDAPGNLLPAGPMQDLLDLHMLMNEMFRKLGRQALRQKSISTTLGQVQDAERVNQTNDGMCANLSSPNPVTELRFGGPDQASMAFLIQVTGLFDTQAGNLRMLSGAGAQSDTATQDQMILAQANKSVQEMSYRTVEFTQGIMEALAWYWWTDPVRTYYAVDRLRGTGEGMVLWGKNSQQPGISPVDRDADFLDLNFRIDPYSLQPVTPSSKLQALMQLLQTILLPLQPVMQQQGQTLAMEPLLQQFSELLSYDGLMEIVQFSEPPQGLQGPYDEPPKKADVSTRNYVRRNVGSGGQPTNPDQQMMQMMQGMMSMGEGAAA